MYQGYPTFNPVSSFQYELMVETLQLLIIEDEWLKDELANALKISVHKLNDILDINNDYIEPSLAYKIRQLREKKNNYKIESYEIIKFVS